VSLLVDALGIEAVATLSRILGGRRLFVPTFSPRGRSVAGRARLVDLVGARIAENLITNFAGTYVHIPKAEPVRYGSIDWREVRRLSRTMSADEIAELLNCSARAIYQIRARHRSGKRPRVIVDHGAVAEMSNCMSAKSIAVLMHCSESNIRRIIARHRSGLSTPKSPRKLTERKYDGCRTT
jgi:hypothetical protein